MLTLGSLFDGIGGFPLAAVNNGIVPLWASEIEPFPIAVTSTHFPQMLHLGDITKLNGAELPPVDIIAGGSPCQDLSVAGARAGLAGARSGLFMGGSLSAVRRAAARLTIHLLYLKWAALVNNKHNVRGTNREKCIHAQKRRLKIMEYCS